MMHNEEENLAEEVSEFIHKSYQPEPPVNDLGNVAAYINKAESSHPANHPVDGIKCRAFPVVTGSRAEFYIRTMLECFGDTDIMYHYSNEFAIPVGHRPPTQLPTDFDSRVKVFEIVDSHVPGYVYLQLAYILTKSKTDGKYIIAEYVSRPNTVLSHEFYVTAGVNEDDEIHGPSACIPGAGLPFDIGAGLNKRVFEPIDTVPCIRCLVWPTQADDWPTRHRNYDWPDPIAVARVVSNGCDVVGVAHSSCTQDEWMTKHQWRLSFSRAEVVLLNSWTPIQQMVYHMLRIFMKTERLMNNAKNSDKSSFSNYHIKTTMLWASELKPLHWWTESKNLVSLLAQCLCFLEEWITKRRGHHYFIKNVYFLDYIDTFSIHSVIAVTKSTTEDCLAQWFVDNYMRKCAEQCPDIIPVLCINTVPKESLHKTTAAILRWKSYILRKGAMEHIGTTFSGTYVPLFRSWKPNPKAVLKLSLSLLGKAELPFTENHIIQSALDYDFFGESPIKNLFVDGFALMCSTKVERRFRSMSSNESNSISCEKKAVVFMKMVADKHPMNHQVEHINFAKAYLVRATRCADSDSDSVYDLANVYMAVLCYISGQRQKATDHCTLATRSQPNPQSSSRVVDGEILPKIDDDIDTVLGLAVFYQYVHTITLKHAQPTQQASVFTAELFAHYFNIRHILVAKCILAQKAQEKLALREVKFHLREELKLIFNRIVSAPRLFLTDVMLLLYANNLCPRRLSSFPITVLDSCNRQQLVEFLTQMPVHRMLRYRESILPQEVDPEFVAVVKTSDFMPLRLYRCKLYERCAQLCQRAVHEMTGQVRPITRLCFLYNEFVQSMNDVVVSLIGMTVLVDKSGTQSKSKLNKPTCINVSELTMSLYLLTQCQIKILSSKMKRDISPLADILDLIYEAENFVGSEDALDLLILKLAERLSVMYITDLLNNFQSI